MKNYTILIFALSVLYFSPSLIFSQDEDQQKDTTVYIDKDFEINIDTLDQNENDDFFDFKEFKFRFRKETHPFFNIRGGLNELAHKSTLNKFRQLGNFEVQLGYSRSFKKSRSYLSSTKDHYLGFAINNKYLYKSSNPQPNELSNYQVSFGDMESYGYQIKNVKLLFGTGREFDWTRITFDRDQVGLDTLILDFYRDAIRFGEAYNAEFSLHLFNFLSLETNYKYGIVFPRHLFWKHVGSYFLEEVAKSLLENYLERIFSMRPAAGPIVNFVLQSSLNYLFYELKKERMNWPFKTAQPLSYEIYSMGIKFTF